MDFRNFLKLFFQVCVFRPNARKINAWFITFLKNMLKYCIFYFLQKYLNIFQNCPHEADPVKCSPRTEILAATLQLIVILQWKEVNRCGNCIPQSGSPIVKMRQGKINEIICIAHKNQIINLANNYLYLRWKKNNRKSYF